MKRNLLKFALCAMAALPLGAWADDILPNRSATNELFRMERQGDHAKYFISSGSFLRSAKLGAAGSDELTNTWQVNADDRYVGFTLPTGYTFQAGDVVSVVGGLNDNYASGRGFKLKDAVSEETFNMTAEVESTYQANKKTTVSYTIQVGDEIIGKSSLYVYWAGTKAYVEKITVTREGADDLVPEAVSDKEWDLATILSSATKDSKFESSIVNDNLYYAKDTPIGIMNDNKYPRLTSGVSNNLDFTSMTQGLAFMVSAGKGVITVYQISTTAPRLYTKSGSSASLLTLITGAQDDVTGLTPHYYEYDISYDTPFAVVRGGGNTYVAKIVVSPNRPISTVDALGYTFSSTLPLDFTGTTVEAYTAEYNNSTKKVTMNRVYKVPANTGLFIKGTADDIPVLTGDPDDMGTNNLVAVSSATSVAETDGGSNTNYVLALADKNYESKGVVFLKATGASVAAGKAYLQIPTDSAPSDSRISVMFDDDETTGIEELKNSKTEELKSYYNLNGQRVAHPTKGLYIVNGKKVIMK